MNDAGGMRGGERVGDLGGEVEQSPERIDRRDRRSCYMLHDEIVRSDVIELANVGMIERGDRSRLAFEPPLKFLVRQLDGDRPVQSGIPGFVDLSHPALADEGDDFVGAESGAGGKHAALESGLRRAHLYLRAS